MENLDVLLAGPRGPMAKFDYRPPALWKGIRRATSTIWLHPRRTAQLVVHDARPFRTGMTVPAMAGDFIAVAERVESIEYHLRGRLRVTTGRTRAGALRTRAAAALADLALLYLVVYETSSPDVQPLLDVVATVRPHRHLVAVADLWGCE